MKGILLSALIVITLILGYTSCGGDQATIKFDGGSCELYEVMLESMYAPADMKENEKSFVLRLKYKLNDNAISDATSVLYDDGQFVAPNGNIYKAGAAAATDSIYSLIVAVPQNVDVESLKYEYNKQTISLKQKEQKK